MVKVLILGSTGMLGSAVGKYFQNNKNFNTILTFRNKEVSYGKNSIFFDAINTPLEDLPQTDYLINCVGVIKPFIEKNNKDSIYINSLFPHKLADFCESKNTKMMHITTDCVFSGKDGKYTEESLHDCLDSYGKSKSLGEPKNCMTIRTSIIGEEIHKNASLIEWAKSMKNKKVNGFTNHLWNGITTKHYSEICEKIILENIHSKSLFHVHSNDVTKLEMLKLISSRLNLNLNIQPTEAKEVCDRTLRTLKELNSVVKTKSIQQQIEEL